MRRRIPLWAFLAAFALQAGLLAWIVADRALLLARGQEIRLKVIPVDPRDLFRGDYVILSYAISTVAADTGGEAFAYGDPIYVALRREGETWTPAGLHRRPEAGQIVLKGRVIGDGADGDGCPKPPCRSYQVEYGLEQFFVPEGQGRALEDLRQDQRLEVDAAVSPSGRAALKRLLVDGAVRYEETLF